MSKSALISRRRLLQLTATSATVTSNESTLDENIEYIGELYSSINDNGWKKVADTEKWSSIVKLEYTVSPSDWEQPRGCTGVLIGEFHVLTAAHCLYRNKSPDNRRIDNDELLVVPAATRGLAPYDRAKVTNIRVHDNWKEYSGSWYEILRSPVPMEYDLALLTLDRNVGRYAGYLSIFHTSDENDDMYEEPVLTVGYPEDPPHNEPMGTMWEVSGEGDGTGGIRFSDNQHNVDMSRITSISGMSGSPRVNENSEILSILSGKPHISHQAVGPRIPTSLYSTLNNWMNQDERPRDSPILAFDTWRWSSSNFKESYSPSISINGKEVSSEEEYELVAGEDIQIAHDVRNLGTSSDSNEFEVMFSLGANELGVESFEIPDPYEVTSVVWDGPVPENSADDSYEVRIELLDTDYDLDPIISEDIQFERESDFTVTVRKPGLDNGETQVTILATNDPIDAGETLEVSAEIANTGNIEVTQDVAFIINDQLREEGTVTIGSDETKTVTFEFETESIETNQEVPVRVETEDDSDGESVLIRTEEDDDNRLERILPVDREITVAPGTRVFFESTAPDELEYGDADWEADGAGVDPVFPHMHYRGFSDNAAWGTFNSAGTYNVRTIVPDEYGGGSVEWTVHVDPNGTDAPTIVEISTDPPASDEATPSDTIDVAATVHDSDDSALARVIWIERLDGTTVEVSNVRGERDTATLAIDGHQWMQYGDGINVWVITEDGRVSDESEDQQGPTVTPPFEINTIETGDSVQAGETLEVSAEIENTRPEISGGESTQEVELVLDSEVVATESVTISAGQTDSISFSYDTDSGDIGELEVMVRSPADEAVTQVTIGESDDELKAEFSGCKHAELTGTFEEGDPPVAVAWYTWYDESDGSQPFAQFGVTVGDEIEAPFSGTIIFEINDEYEESQIIEGSDEVTAALGDTGINGAAITGIDITGMGAYDFQNPHDCFEEIRPERPSLAVEEVIHSEGEGYEVTFSYENPNDGSIPVGQYVESEFISGITDYEPPEELVVGDNTFTVGWVPESDDERLVWELDLSEWGYENPVRVETEPAREYDVGEPELELTITGTNTPIRAGEDLEVTVQVQNTGSESTTQEIGLIVGHEPEQLDRETVSVEPNETDTITLGYETPIVESDQQFPIRVQSEDDEDEQIVLVYGTAEEEEEPLEEEESSEEELPEDDESPEEPPGDPPEEPPGDPPEEPPGDPPEEPPSEGPSEEEGPPEQPDDAEPNQESPTEEPPEDESDPDPAPEPGPESE